MSRKFLSLSFSLLASLTYLFHSDRFEVNPNCQFEHFHWLEQVLLPFVYELLSPAILNDLTSLTCEQHAENCFYQHHLIFNFNCFPPVLQGYPIV